MRGIFATGFVVALLGILLLETIVPAVATRHEIAYDSGIPGGSVSLPYTPTEWSGGYEEVNAKNVWKSNSMLAVRFTPNSSSVQMLVQVRFYIAEDLASFNVWLFDADRQFLIYYRQPSPAAGSQYISDVYRWTITPTSIGWQSLNVTDKDPIFLTRDFYVGIEFTPDQRPRLGVDTTGQRNNRGWFIGNQTGWVEYSAYAEQHGLPDGNLMIRAVTVPVSEVATTTMATTTKNLTESWELPTAIAAIVLVVVAVVGIWQVRKRRQVG